MPRILTLLLLITVHCILITAKAQTCLPDVAPTTPDSGFTIHANGTVTHARTALVWDRCPLGQSGANCEQGAATEYTWEQAQQQAEIANQNAYKGHTDWRLPTKRELASIVEYQCHSPAINETAFPATPSSGFWSSSPLAGHSNYAWGVLFSYGYVSNYSKDGAWGVRLVRGGQALVSLPEEAPQSCNNGAVSLPAEFDIHGDGTVTHTRTGLMWDRCAYGQQGSHCGTGSAADYTWTEALQAVTDANARAYKGYRDWRLPDAYELHTITEETCKDPALNTTAFPAAPSSGFWSSSPFALYSHVAWSIHFFNGSVDYSSLKDGAWGVRLVRGGQALVSLPENQPPIAAFSLNPTGGTAPLPVILDAGASGDPEGAPLTYAWTLNGQPFGGSSVQVGNTFGPGEYDITLTVSDGDLSAQAAPQHLSVTYPPPPPLPPALTLYSGDSRQIDAPTQAPPLTWTSSNPAVVSVDNSGTLTAHAAGGVTVTVADVYQQENRMTVQVAARDSGDDDDAPGFAIVVAGGGAHQSNLALFKQTHALSTRFYRLLHDRGLSHERILFLDPLAPDTDGDGLDNPEHRDYFLHTAQADLNEAFARAAQNLSAGQQFVFYFHGHAQADVLKANRGEGISAAQLRTWLDSLPADSTQIVIVDACFSGALLDDLAAPGRTVIASTAADSVAWEMENVSFSDELGNQLRRGDNLLDAFRYAAESLDTPRFRHQQAQLDDDGDGLFTNRDGRRAETLYLLGEGRPKADPPDILSLHPALNLAAGQSEAVLWVKTFEAPAQLRQVRATLLPPGYQTPAYQGETTDPAATTNLEMLFNPAQQRYEALFNGFYQAGTWRVYYQAEGNDGLLSTRMPGEVKAGGVSAAVDVRLNLSRYAPGDRFRLETGVSGTRRADLYVALVFPPPLGFYLVGYPNLIHNPLGGLQPYVTDIDLGNTPPYPVFDFPLPAGLMPGGYAACAVLTAPGEALMLNGENWLHFECEGFGVLE